MITANDLPLRACARHHSSCGILPVEVQSTSAGCLNYPCRTPANDLAVRRALEAAGVIFIDENGGASPGVRLRKPQRKNAYSGQPLERCRARTQVLARERPVVAIHKRTLALICLSDRFLQSRLTRAPQCNPSTSR
jgi:hypothetical protein